MYKATFLTISPLYALIALGQKQTKLTQLNANKLPSAMKYEGEIKDFTKKLWNKNK